MVKRYINYKNAEYLCNLFASFVIGFYGLIFVLPGRFWSGEVGFQVVMVLMVISIIFGLVNIVLRLFSRKFDIGIVPNIFFILGFSVFLFILLGDK